jgi:hypothetical protein
MLSRSKIEWRAPLIRPRLVKMPSHRGPAYIVVAALGTGALGLLPACSSAASLSNVPVAAAPPPKDDGRPAEGGVGGSEHSKALEQLKVGRLEGRTDKQNSVRILLPDAENWTRVRFWGVPSLVGFRYGKDHHAIVAGFITSVDAPTDGTNAAPGACGKSFEAWATPWVDAFDVDIKHEAPRALVWHGELADIDVLFARTATVADHGGYAVAYGAYPAWKGACLIVGVAVPAREDEGRAREVRDRFAQEVLSHVEVLTKDEPKERY